MSNKINNINKETLTISSAELDGIQFNNIYRSGYNSVKRYVLADTPWYTLDAQTSVKPAVNAVDIDWNAAVIPYGFLNKGYSVTVNSTGELLSLISKMQQEIYYSQSNIFGNLKNLYNDLVSNRKVYLQYVDSLFGRRYNPVFLCNITDDTNTKTIVVYTFAYYTPETPYNYYCGVPYAIKYVIPITITSGSSGDDVWECEEYQITPLYEYFSPTVLIEVDGNSTTYSTIDIRIGGQVATFFIDIPIIKFLKCCDILAKVKGDNTGTYWRLEGSYIDTTISDGIPNTSGTITRYMYRIDNNERYTISISWDLNNNTITTLATLINS